MDPAKKASPPLRDPVTGMSGWDARMFGFGFGEFLQELLVFIINVWYFKDIIKRVVSKSFMKLYCFLEGVLQGFLLLFHWCPRHLSPRDFLLIIE